MLWNGIKSDKTAQDCVCCPASFLSPKKELGAEENDYSVPICIVNTAPPLNSSPCNPAVFDFNEFLQHLRSLLKTTVQTDSSLGVWKCLTGRYKMPGDSAEYLSFFFIFFNYKSIITYLQDEYLSVKHTKNITKMVWLQWEKILHKVKLEVK